MKRYALESEFDHGRYGEKEERPDTRTVIMTDPVFVNVEKRKGALLLTGDVEQALEQSLSIAARKEETRRKLKANQSEETQIEEEDETVDEDNDLIPVETVKVPLTQITVGEEVEIPVIFVPEESKEGRTVEFSTKSGKVKLEGGKLTGLEPVESFSLMVKVLDTDVVESFKIEVIKKEEE